MKRSAVVLCFSIVFGPAQVSRAEPRSKLQLDARIGSVRAPFFVEGIPEVASEYQAYALVAAADLALKDWRVGIRLPFATSSIEQPAGSYVADYTLGNPELFAERLILRAGPHPGGKAVRYASRGRVALGLPLAGHGPASTLVRSRVVAASNAVLGWRQPELYTPGVLPITPGLSLMLEREPWQLGLDLKVPLLVRLHDAALPAATHTRALGVLGVLELEASLQPLRSLAVGAGGALVAVMAAPVEPVRDIGRSGKLQMSVGPRVTLIPMTGLALELDLSLALGGPLDGTASIGLSAQFEHSW